MDFLKKKILFIVKCDEHSSAAPKENISLVNSHKCRF